MAKTKQTNKKPVWNKSLLIFPLCSYNYIIIFKMLFRFYQSQCSIHILEKSKTLICKTCILATEKARKRRELADGAPTAKLLDWNSSGRRLAFQAWLQASPLLLSKMIYHLWQLKHSPTPAGTLCRGECNYDPAGPGDWFPCSEQGMSFIHSATCIGQVFVS